MRKGCHVILYKRRLLEFPSRRHKKRAIRNRVRNFSFFQWNKSKYLIFFYSNSIVKGLNFNSFHIRLHMVDTFIVNRGRCCNCVPFLYGSIVSWICRYRLLSFAIVLWSFFCKKNGWETFLPGFVWLGISPHRLMYIVVKAFPISATTRPRRNCNFRVFSEVKTCGKFESIAY